MNFTITFWTIFGVSIWIDLLTALIFLFIKKKKKSQKNINKPVTVMIPVHRESLKDIEKTIISIYKEDFKLKNCIICGDSDSENIKSLVKKLSQKYKNLVYIESSEKSKARKINYIVRSKKEFLCEFLYVRDCNVQSNDNSIKDLLINFNDNKIAAVTSNGYVEPPKNFLGRSYHYGKEWINKLGWFRKLQQEKRQAVFVVCGASTLYRTSVLRKIPIPDTTKTEDTHYTWKLQIEGYKIAIAKETKIFSPDVEGKYFKGLFKQIRQSYRWSSGTVQCLYIERKNLSKNKKLLYTTIIPGAIEALTYSIALVLLPLIFFISPTFFWGFIIGDTFFSLLGTILFTPKRLLHTIFHYPQIMFYKYINASIFLTALITVTFQRIFYKNTRWSNEWKS